MPSHQAHAKRRKSCKNYPNALDCRSSVVILTIPPEAGLYYIGVRSTYIWGLQIGAQFCPDMFIGPVSAEQTRVQVGRKIEFFCGLKCT